MIQNTTDFQFLSPIQFNKKFNKKFWDKIQFNKIFNKKILDKIQFKTLFNSNKFNSKNYSISKISRIFNSKFDSKCWNRQDSIQQYIHSIRKRGYRSPLSHQAPISPGSLNNVKTYCYSTFQVKLSPHLIFGFIFWTMTMIIVMLNVDARVHVHASCVDTGTWIDTILMLTRMCWNRCCWCFSGDVDVDEDGDVLTLLLIVDFNFGNVFICVCIPWPLLFFTNLTPHW